MDDKTQALRSLKAKRKLMRYAAIYVVVFVVLVGIWVWSGDSDIWPAWPVLVGAVVLAFLAGRSAGSDDVAPDSERGRIMDDREQALRQLESKRRFTRHAVVYGSMIAFFVGIWALSDGDYFWPVWPALVWGVVLAIHAWITFGQRPISDADLERQSPPGLGAGKRNRDARRPWVRSWNGMGQRAPRSGPRRRDLLVCAIDQGHPSRKPTIGSGHRRTCTHFGSGSLPSELSRSWSPSRATGP
jgi:hypothetical protein